MPLPRSATFPARSAASSRNPARSLSRSRSIRRSRTSRSAGGGGGTPAPATRFWATCGGASGSRKTGFTARDLHPWLTPSIHDERVHWCGVVMVRFLRRLLGDKKGVTAIEYGLIAALIAVAAVNVMGTVGTRLSTTFNTIATKL